jgi:hypothetical protein
MSVNDKPLIIKKESSDKQEGSFLSESARNVFHDRISLAQKEDFHSTCVLA